MAMVSLLVYLLLSRPNVLFTYPLAFGLVFYLPMYNMDIYPRGVVLNFPLQRYALFSCYYVITVLETLDFQPQLWIIYWVRLSLLEH
jgi:hypothetical protein